MVDNIVVALYTHFIFIVNKIFTTIFHRAGAFWDAV